MSRKKKSLKIISCPNDVPATSTWSVSVPFSSTYWSHNSLMNLGTSLSSCRPSLLPVRTKSCYFVFESCLFTSLTGTRSLKHVYSITIYVRLAVSIYRRLFLYPRKIPNLFMIWIHYSEFDFVEYTHILT